MLLAKKPINSGPRPASLQGSLRTDLLYNTGMSIETSYSEARANFASLLDRVTAEPPAGAGHEGTTRPVLGERIAGTRSIIVRFDFRARPARPSSTS